MRKLFIAFGFFVLLSGCNSLYVEKQFEEITSEENQQKLGGVINTVKQETEAMIEAGEHAVEVGKDAMGNAGNEAAKPLNSGKRTDSNVKQREQMMEDAGGQMIDEMRDSPVDLVQ